MLGFTPRPPYPWGIVLGILCVGGWIGAALVLGTGEERKWLALPELKPNCPAHSLLLQRLRYPGSIFTDIRIYSDPQPRIQMELRDQLHAPASLPQGKQLLQPGKRCVGGWVVSEDNSVVLAQKRTLILRSYSPQQSLCADFAVPLHHNVLIAIGSDKNLIFLWFGFILPKT